MLHKFTNNLLINIGILDIGTKINKSYRDVCFPRYTVTQKNDYINSFF